MLSQKLNQALLASVVLAATSMTATAGHGQHHDRFQDRARVISVAPHTQHVKAPRQECRTEYVETRRSRKGERFANKGAVIGGVVGGLIGHRIGQKTRADDSVFATVIGAGVGAAIGHRHDRKYQQNRRVETRPVERCYTVNRNRVNNRGYLVDYRYGGQRYSTVTRHRPGRYLPVDVTRHRHGHILDVRHGVSQRKHFSKHKRQHRYDRQQARRHDRHMKRRWGSGYHGDSYIDHRGKRRYY